MPQTTQLEDHPFLRYNPAVRGAVNTVEWMVIALILAFTFRAFVMEAFRIPTGSMAETLRGEHYALRCHRCGYRFDVGADSAIGPTCPSCSYVLPPDAFVPISNGDRILVLKSIYQFKDPRRWDVVVFKNPSDPIENYIKRMVALPGETIEIIDGDIYINNRIARKPPRVQRELWMPIYTNDYQPSPEMVSAAVADDRNPGPEWRQPFQNEPGCDWDLNAGSGTVFELNSVPDSRVQTIRYVPLTKDDFKCTYGYNHSRLNYSQPVCSDLMIQYYVINQSRDGVVGAVIEKYVTSYFGRVNFKGTMQVGRLVNGSFVELATAPTPVTPGKASQFRFAIVDHQLVLEYGNEKLRFDLGDRPGAMGEISKLQNPQAKIFGTGTLRLMHTGIYRDTYYISRGNERAGTGEPFTLGKDEFFVCGDNSPNSSDARLWRQNGKGNNGKTYNAGTVPRDYLMGKAFAIYWSNAFRPTPNIMPIIPNVSRVGLIYGSSEKTY